MDTRDAVTLIGGAVQRGVGTWADLGAGDGTFTRALAELLGAGSRIYAVDRDAGAVRALARWAPPEDVEVVPVRADFTAPLDLPRLAAGRLDGLLFANSLHFIREPCAALARLAARLRTGGRVVVVEYDERAANRWVPFPIPAARLPAVAGAAGLSPPAITATRPSAFGGVLYVAALMKS